MSARQPAPCGTLRGERRHRRAGEQPCEPCLEARRAYDRSRYVHRRVLHPCGTDSAYQRHRRAGEPIDKACRDAHTSKVRAWRQAAEFNQMLAEAWAETAVSDAA
jgi:hypothetical protein